MMPILVFLHGLLGTKQDWQYIIEELKKIYRTFPHNLIYV